MLIYPHARHRMSGVSSCVTVGIVANLRLVIFGVCVRRLLTQWKAKTSITSYIA
ncbi:hypothetical protein BDV40DRAFT_254275 [Aspergillus tamarii]|uniref:Uncharacterized protein n=1 Tax=Aspergillus tamarii TaxID=41984 RepID=A0A5N6V8X4_ASPTM|nr:hypothetical protein BDV40DRAFT_254275 [Aspergillus tamarii]